MATGGRRSDFTTEDNLTPGEERTLRHVVKDKDGVNVTDFTGWEFEWFLLNYLGELNGLAALQTADAAIIYKMDSDITDSVPNVDVPIAVADWPDPGDYAYELWRVDAGNENRLAYGRFPVIP